MDKSVTRVSVFFYRHIKGDNLNNKCFYPAHAAPHGKQITMRYDSRMKAEFRTDAPGDDYAIVEIISKIRSHRI